MNPNAVFTPKPIPILVEYNDMASSTVTKRTQKSQEQLDILEAMYDKGMTCYGRDNIGSLTLLREAVEQTGLTEIQVKVQFPLYRHLPTDEESRK